MRAKITEARLKYAAKGCSSVAVIAVTSRGIIASESRADLAKLQEIWDHHSTYPTASLSTLIGHALACAGAEMLRNWALMVVGEPQAHAASGIGVGGATSHPTDGMPF
jgi:hypothetical protein